MNNPAVNISSKLSKNLSATSLTTSVAIVSLLGALSGCGTAPESKSSETTEAKTSASSETAENTQRTQTNEKVVTIYSSRNEQLIKPLLDKYSSQTGTKIELVTDKSGPLMARLQAEGSNTPADMLLTVDAGNLWQASNKGLLQPFTSEAIEKNVPARYRDPENRWTGLSLRARTIFYNPEKVNANELSTYADLGQSRWKDKLCLRTSKKVYNQSLVASMINHLGEDKATEVVKGWVKNLATDVFSDDTSLLKAIDSGQCAVGIANSYYYGRLLDKNPDLKVKVFWANQQTTGVHMNVSGAGVVTHADNASGALELIEWLSSDEAQDIYSSADKEYPVKDDVPVSEMLKSWGGFVPDSMNVGLFGEMQTEAIQLMDKAGYK